jgi:hypothetical protein
MPLDPARLERVRAYLLAGVASTTLGCTTSPTQPEAGAQSAAPVTSPLASPRAADDAAPATSDAVPLQPDASAPAASSAPAIDASASNVRPPLKRPPPLERPPPIHVHALPLKERRGVE